MNKKISLTFEKSEFVIAINEEYEAYVLVVLKKK